VKALIIACNTVSAVAVEVLRAELDMPVIGVVAPGALAAVRAAEAVAERTGGPPPKIGVLGTAGTIASGAYSREVQKLSTRLEVVGQAAPLLVPLVEEGWLDGEVPELAVRRYAEALLDAGAGVIVLGCTHYPLLRPVVEKVLLQLAGHSIPVVDSALAAGEAVCGLLQGGGIPAAIQRDPNRASIQLLVTDQPVGFQRSADLFLGEHTPIVEQIDLAAG
jgi:glutamate racemase